MIGKLLNENYFLDPTSGLAFKLNLIIMGKYANNLQKIHDEVMRVGRPVPQRGAGMPAYPWLVPQCLGGSHGRPRLLP